MAVVTVFGLIMTALKTETGKFHTAQPQVLIFVLSAVALMTTTKEMIVAMILVTVVENLQP